MKCAKEELFLELEGVTVARYHCYCYYVQMTNPIHRSQTFVWENPFKA